MALVRRRLRLFDGALRARLKELASHGVEWRYPCQTDAEGFVESFNPLAQRMPQRTSVRQPR
jgi:hypothetical protein